MADPQAPYCRLTGQIVTPAGGIPRLKLYARPIITQGVAKAGVSPADVQFATDDQGNIAPLDGAVVDVVAPGPGVNAPDRFQYQVLVYGPGLIETGYLRAEQGKTIDLNTVLPGAPYDGGLLASRVHASTPAAGAGTWTCPTTRRRPRSPQRTGPRPTSPTPRRRPRTPSRRRPLRPSRRTPGGGRSPRG